MKAKGLVAQSLTVLSQRLGVAELLCRCSLLVRNLGQRCCCAPLRRRDLCGAATSGASVRGAI
jgi:hypothetical protein